MPLDIAVVGSCNLDLVVNVEKIPTVGQTILGGDLSRIPGGKGANQAVAAARLGYRSAMIGRIGDDGNGEFLRKGLDNDGVDTSVLLITDGIPSGIAMITVQRDGDNSIVVSPGANAHLSPDDIMNASNISDATTVLAQAEIPIETVLAAARNTTGSFIKPALSSMIGQ